MADASLCIALGDLDADPHQADREEFMMHNQAVGSAEGTATPTCSFSDSLKSCPMSYVAGDHQGERRQKRCYKP